MSDLLKVQEASLSFNKDVFGNIFKRKMQVESRIKGIQKSLDRVDFVQLVLLESQLQKEYNQILFQEELHWFQKSRDNWIKLGDRNTKYFHA